MGFLGGGLLVQVGWDGITFPPGPSAQGNKDGPGHGARAPCAADPNSKLWHSRSQTFLRAEHHKETSLCFFPKPKKTWKTKLFPELAVGIRERWRNVLINAGLNAQILRLVGHAGCKHINCNNLRPDQQFRSSLEASNRITLNITASYVTHH